MTKKTWRALAAAGALAAFAAAVVAVVMGGCPSCVETAAGACVPMKCTYAARAASLFEALAGACLCGLIAVQCKVGRRWLAGVSVGAQACTAAVLYTPIVGLCADAAMHCHATATACTVLGACSVALALAAFALADPQRATLPKRGL